MTDIFLRWLPSLSCLTWLFGELSPLGCKIQRQQWRRWNTMAAFQDQTRTTTLHFGLSSRGSWSQWSSSSGSTPWWSWWSAGRTATGARRSRYMRRQTNEAGKEVGCWEASWEAVDIRWKLIAFSCCWKSDISAALIMLPVHNCRLEKIKHQFWLIFIVIVKTLWWNCL